MRFFGAHTGWMAGVLFLVLSSFAAADEPISICKRDRAALDSIRHDPEMRMGFDNEGGIFGGGVCWWHSRMQRAAWHLVKFAPEKAPPSEQRAAQIFHDLAHLNKVVVIPGYTSFRKFTHDYRLQAQRELNQWQMRDATLNMAWLRGLMRKGQYKNPAKAKQWMDVLYQKFRAHQKRNETTWVKLQIPGVSAHAALILDMQKNSDGGYTFEAVDSNYPERNLDFVYRAGSGTLDAPVYFEDMMPFAGYERDYKKIHRTVSQYCR